MPTADDIDTLARTLYGEARGCNLLDRLAVCAVVRERVLRPGWWTRERGDGIPDDTYQAACRDPWQFSVWNKGDPNRDKILNAHETAPLLFRGLSSLAEYTIYQMTDADVLDLFDTDGPERFPTHYFSRPLTKPPNAWGDDIEEVQPKWQGSVFRFWVVRKGRPARA